MSRFVTMFSVVLLALSSTTAFCQDQSSTKDTETADTETADAKVKAVDEEPAEAKEASPVDLIKDLLAQKDLDAAVTALDAAVANDPNEKSLQMLRSTMAGQLYRNRKYDEAFDQIDKRLQFLIRNLSNQSESKLAVNQLVGATVVMRLYALGAERPERATELIDKVTAAIEAATKDEPNTYAKAMGTMVPLKTAHLATQASPEQGRAALKKYLADLDDIAGLSDEVRLTTTGRYLAANMNMPNAQAADRQMLAEFLTSLRESHADSPELMNEYVRLELSAIRGTYRTEPEFADEHVKLLKSTLDETDLELKNLARYERELESYEMRIASALRVLRMVGKPAPRMEIDAWVNQGETTEDSLKGKVVLLDFWAVWCGPCIATFPHLREWKEEFGDKGFEIIGVTRYYNYNWDDEAGRAVRSKEEVSHSDEQTMLKNFLEHYELTHPTIVTPQDSKMQSQFGVTGIPHVVLIDREGKVQLVKVGAGASTSDQIHKKLVELIAQ